MQRKLTLISSIDLSLIAAKMLSMYDDQGAHVIGRLYMWLKVWVR